MATALTAGRIYILDWSSSDADSYDLDGKTEGTNYVSMKIPDSFMKKMDQEGKKSIYYGGGGFFFRYDKMKESVTAKGSVLSLAQAEKWDKFFHVRQGAGTSADYFVWYRGTSDYLPFHNYDGTDKNGVGRGWFSGCKIQYTMDENMEFPIQIKFDIVWS